MEKKTFKGYVYTGKATLMDLEKWGHEYLGKPIWHWVADTAHFTVSEGYPPVWKDQGAVFNTNGELRWRRMEGKKYEIMLLTLVPVSGLQEVPGKWEVQELNLYLQDLTEARVNPQFERYPTGQSYGRIRALLYLRDKKPVFVSLREFLEEE